MKIIVFSLCCLYCTVVFCQPPAVLTTPASSLRLFKEDLSKINPHALDLVKRLRTAADSLLTMQPVSVMNKAFTPESGDKHDYMSQAPYFWYDSSKPNGKPYLRRDGQRNPEIYNITDRTDLGRLADASRLLALAWYAAGDEKYARKATALLETWFINDATRMHPNLDFGQAIPGVNSGRGIGIIETVSLLQITDAAILLQGSAAWTSMDAAALKNWFAAYLNWMLTSKNGRDEHAAKNNHGTWYFAQAIDFALFSGDNSRASSLLRESEVRLDSQLNASQPLLPGPALISGNTQRRRAQGSKKRSTGCFRLHSAANPGSISRSGTIMRRRIFILSCYRLPWCIKIPPTGKPRGPFKNRDRN
jgi:hypothetical protein